MAEEVRARRDRAGLTRKALAQRSGLSERFLTELEAGRANISLLSLQDLASALGARLVDLLGPERPAGARVVALLGLRGAGKSTIGKALAERLGTGFFELDRLVEVEAGMALPELFAIHGEGYYRDLELRALRRFLGRHDSGVLATGGGLVTSPDAYALLKEQTTTVWLKADPEQHWNRVVKQGDLRPMKDRPQAMAELRRRLKEREPLYSQARHTCDTDGRTVAAIVEEIRLLG